MDISIEIGLILKIIHHCLSVSFSFFRPDITTPLDWVLVPRLSDGAHEDLPLIVTTDGAMGCEYGRAFPR